MICRSSWSIWKLLRTSLSEQIVSGQPLLAINLFNALMNSSVVWSGNNSKWTAYVKLHLKRSMYAFFSPLFILRYMIGPAKAVPIFWKVLAPVVLCDRKMTSCCVVKGVAWYLLHPKQFLVTLFAICFSLGIQ